MRVLPEFVSAVALMAASIFAVLPIVRANWHWLLRFMSFLVAIALTVVALLYKEFTGRGIDDVVGQALAEFVCTHFPQAGCDPERIAAAYAERAALETRRRAAEQRMKAAADAARKAEEDAQLEMLDAARKKAEDKARSLREVEAARLLKEERDRRLLAEAEALRRKQEELERQRLADEVLKRQAEAARRAQEERERQRLAEETRLREIETERRRQEERERELRSRRYAATAVGKVEATRGFRATTYFDQPSIAEAETKALARCSQEASDCRIIARFGGPGKCVYVVAGSITIREPGGVRRKSGVRAAGTESDALAKCRAEFEGCSVFHMRCNSPP